MLAKIINTFWPDIAIERQARGIWNNGAFILDFRAPGLGEQWDAKYLPFWRKWVGEAGAARETMYDSSYASIDDQTFWRRAVSQFDGKCYALALENSAGRGNLEVFKVFERQHIQAWADRYKTPRESAAMLPLVHPDAVALMRNEGYWDQPDIDAMAEDYRFLNEYTGRLQEVDGYRRLPVPKKFAQDWCVKVLRDYQWSADKQAQFMGHMLMTLKGKVWLENEHLLKPLLAPGVAMTLVAAVAGFDPKYYGDVPEHKGINLLHQSIQQVSQYCRQNTWMSGFSTVWQPEPLAIKGGHPGMNILMELLPAERPIDLYRAALLIKQRELGLAVTESFALPQLA